jgi:oxalate decarboxylase/phosphoglucose isomerase-like protein (cupin superfamily)
VYTIYRDLWSNNEERDTLLHYGMRYDVTEMLPLMLGEEYVKTFGHDHLPWRGAWSHPEIFEIIEGEACFLVQTYQGEDVTEVSLVVAREDDVVLIPQSCGHVMINASSKRLITGNLISRNCNQTYQRFVQRKGGAYFMLKGGKLVRNENYPSLPEVRFVGVGPLDFVNARLGLLESFRMHPESFRFLDEPSQ